jgi:hypothetical protein
MADPVTTAHLEAVRGETHALMAALRAEMEGSLKELATKLDASRHAQETDSLALRGALERLTDQVARQTRAVGALESGDQREEAVHTALSKFKVQISRRIYLAATLLIAALAAVAAYLH